MRSSLLKFAVLSTLQGYQTGPRRQATGPRAVADSGPGPEGLGLKRGAERSNRVFDLLRERLVVVPAEPPGRPKRDAGGAALRPLPVGIEDLVHVVEPDRHDGHVEPGADHRHARPEALHCARWMPRPLGKDQDGVTVRRDLADVAKRLARAGLALR